MTKDKTYFQYGGEYDRKDYCGTMAGNVRHFYRTTYLAMMKRKTADADDLEAIKDLEAMVELLKAHFETETKHD